MDIQIFINEVAKLRSLQKASLRLRTSMAAQAAKRQEKIIDAEINRLIGSISEKGDQGTINF